jgi:hypothetical protein
MLSCIVLTVAFYVLFWLKWALTKVGLRHPHLFKFVAEHLVGKGEDPEVRGRGLELFDGQGISNIAYVYARHAQLGAEVLQQFGKKCRLPVTGGRLACYTVSYLDISESLLRKLYSEIARIDLAGKCPSETAIVIASQFFATNSLSSFPPKKNSR